MTDFTCEICGMPSTVVIHEGGLIEAILCWGCFLEKLYEISEQKAEEMKEKRRLWN